MKQLRVSIIISLGIGLSTLLNWQVVNAQHSFYDFTVKDLYGDEYDLAQLQGKKVLVVNTASKCGFTPQYKELENLYKTYGGEDFIILAFPSNDFGNREPGSNEEIAEFCSSKYHITFPVMAKITVKGDEMHPLYRWLTQASENGIEESRVTWNFQKYMIDGGGTLVGHVSPIKKPDCKEILSWISEE
jgi:glutathione peroxidase